jgi:P-type Ca2+ transporter type 2C
VALLLAAALVTTILGDVPDTAVIVLVVTINALIGVLQEIRADAGIAALDRLAAPTARVVRDGHDMVLPAAELVRDDLVRLEAGDVVPADLRLTEVQRAAFDESALTGESVAVHRATGEVAGSDTVPAGETPASLLLLARAGLLCNDADLIAPSGERTEWTAAGDPMEATLVAFSARCGLDTTGERAALPRVAEQPFDQATRRMTTVHRQHDGSYLIVRKGPPENVLDPQTDAALLGAAAELAADGLRVLALTTAITTTQPDPANPPPLRADGLVGIGDPLRPSARQTAAAFEASGVRLLLITGDHPATAAAIGTQLGILESGDRVAVGDAGPPADDDIEHARVYARTQPEQKLDIIAGLQQRGEVVAMTGDRVNDAPALRRADIGVAMGSGTEAARQVAELVLVDDNLGTVADAIGEGRRIYDNIRRFLRYALSGGIAELLVMLAGPLLGMPLALLPSQLIWINLLTHGIPGVRWAPNRPTPTF